MATLTVTASHDYRGDTLTNITDLFFAGPSAGATATFSSDQFDGTHISTTLQVAGDVHVDAIDVFLSASASFSAAGWTFTSWSNTDAIDLEGSTSGDTITGSSVADVIVGYGGADHLNGGGGNDRFGYIFSGNFSSDIGAGETVDGGAGVDTIVMSTAGSFDFSPLTVTSVEHLRWTAGGTADLIQDQIGLGHITTLIGSSGTDQLVVHGFSVSLAPVTFQSWTAGTDTISIEGSSLASNTLIGSSQRDMIDGLLNSNDTIEGGGGADSLNGDGGNDVFVYAATTDTAFGETVDGGAGTDKLLLANTGTIDFSFGVTLTGIEAVQFAIGNNGVQFAPDQIGAGGITSVIGATGQNTIFVAGADVDLSSLTFSSWTQGTDQIKIFGGASADTLIGSSQTDLIQGGAGADALHGGGGDDAFIYGGVGNFAAAGSISGGSGTDSLAIFGGSVDFSAAALTSVESLFLAGLTSATATLAAGQIGIGPITTVAGSGGTQALIVNGANANLSSLSFSNWLAGTDTVTINGTSAADTLTGSSQNDTIKGAAGPDTLAGLAGDDRYFVDTSSDIVHEVAGNGADRVLASVSYTLQAGQEIETLSTDKNAGTDAINLTGNEFGQQLIGNAGNNVLRGQDGDDILMGGVGVDKLTGGAGFDQLKGGADDDRFIYTALSDSGITAATRDKIAGFAAGDKIDVHLIDPIAGGADAFVLDDDGSFDAGEIDQTVTASGDLRLDFNVDANTTPEMSILLATHTALLTSGDFIL